MSTSKNLWGSYSVPNVNLVYVCLVGNITPGNLGNKSTDGCESTHSRLSISRPSLHIINNVDGEVGTSKDDDTAIEVQRSVAFHELEKVGNIEYYPDKIEEVASEQIPLPQHMEDNSEDESDYINPKILSLTKAKWLSDSRDGSPDARVSPLQSESESSVMENLPKNYSNHKALSTVLALDKELNLFGLSNTYIEVAGRNVWKKPSNKPVFHQTSIVQACFKACCRRKSKTDLPSSLKCGGTCVRCTSCTSCTSACLRSCSCCSIPCNPPCNTPCVMPCGVPYKTPCPPFYSKPCPPKSCCPKPCSSCSKPCRPKLCYPKSCSPCAGCCAPICKDCPRFGFQISVIKKPKYDPVYSEIEPKSSCVLSKALFLIPIYSLSWFKKRHADDQTGKTEPLLARSCNHSPRCIPPSSCFPYLMPCFWTARPGAPCCEPARCFHNPPCPRGRAPRSHIDPKELCPHGHTCIGKDKSEKCENLSCIGRNNEALAKALTEYQKMKSASQKKPAPAQSPHKKRRTPENNS